MNIGIKNYLKKHLHITCSECGTEKDYPVEDITPSEFTDLLIQLGWREVDMKGEDCNIYCPSCIISRQQDVVKMYPKSTIGETTDT